MTAVTANPPAVDLPLQSLIDIRFHVQQWHSNTSAGGQNSPGQRLTRKRGQGIDFLDLRQYTEGDDVRHIDWNVTARTNEPYTRLYRQEQEQSTTVIVDMRPVMFNGSDCLRSVAAGRLAATALWQAAHSGDRCSSMVISHPGITTSRPQSGNRGVLAALELIATGFEQSAAMHKTPTNNGPQLSDGLDLVTTNKRNNGCYLIFSGFDTAGDTSYDDALLSTAAARQVHAIVLLDKLEQQSLPVGSYRYRFKGNPGRVTVNNTTSNQLTELITRQTGDKISRLNKAGIDAVPVDTTTRPTDFLTTLQKQGF